MRTAVAAPLSLLALLLNGEAAVPFLVTAPRFKTYDIADVKVTALRPPGGPVGAPTAVTVYGEGFADLGAGQQLAGREYVGQREASQARLHLSQ